MRRSSTPRLEWAQLGIEQGSEGPGASRPAAFPHCFCAKDWVGGQTAAGGGQIHPLPCPAPRVGRGNGRAIFVPAAAAATNEHQSLMLWASPLAWRGGWGQGGHCAQELVPGRHGRLPWLLTLASSDSGPQVPIRGRLWASLRPQQARASTGEWPLVSLAPWS